MARRVKDKIKEGSGSGPHGCAGLKSGPGYLRHGAIGVQLSEPGWDEITCQCHRCGTSSLFPRAGGLPCPHSQGEQLRWISTLHDPFQWEKPRMLQLGKPKRYIKLGVFNFALFCFSQWENRKHREKCVKRKCMLCPRSWSPSSYIINPHIFEKEDKALMFPSQSSSTPSLLQTIKVLTFTVITF